MPYQLTEDQVMLRESVGRLAREKLAPRAEEQDKKAGDIQVGGHV